MSDIAVSENQIRRVGILGGTFDPVHIGHTRCALEAMNSLGLDEVVMIPAAKPSFKRDAELTDIGHRLKMCSLSIEDEDGLSVSDIEAKRDGITYSIDTIEQMRAGEYAGCDLHFIIGSDAFLTLPKWHRAKDLAALVSFVVLMRCDDDPSSVEDVAREMDANIDIVDSERLDVSSSQIRRLLEDGEEEAAEELLSNKVFEYIKDKGLYRG